jgi:hypothetical protein
MGGASRRGGGRRRLTVTVATIGIVLGGLALLPVPAFAATGSGGGATGCDHTSYGRVDVGTSMTEITNGGGVSCQMPVPGSHVSAPGGDPPHLEGPPPADGTPCTMRALQPVSLSIAGVDITAAWHDPDGQAAGDIWDDTKYADIYVPGRMHLYGHQSGTHDILVPYQYQNGTYKDGRCQGGKWVEVQSPTSSTQCEERSDSLYIPQGSCAIGPTHLPAPVIDPTQPPPDVLSLMGQIQAQIAYGQVHSRPDNIGPVQGLVNLPTFFWMTGIDGNLHRQFEIVSPGPADGSGRRIVYQYVIDVRLNGITWNFGDGTTATSQGPGSEAQPAVSHSYSTISQRGCRACGSTGLGTAYRVSAAAHYGIEANVVWNNGAGDHSEAVPGATRTFDAPPQLEDLFVGQIEGVPGTT